MKKILLAALFLSFIMAGSVFADAPCNLEDIEGCSTCGQTRVSDTDDDGINCNHLPYEAAGELPACEDAFYCKWEEVEQRKLCFHCFWDGYPEGEGECMDDEDGNPYTCTGGGCTVGVCETSCFPAGTKITMADGSYKNIEDVEVGDFVLSYDTKKKVYASAEVLDLEEPMRAHLCYIDFEDGSVLRTTNDHPLYTQDGWKAIDIPETKELVPHLKLGQLEIGDKVLSDSGEYNAIVSLECKKEVVKTYNLIEVERYNNFFAEGVLVHNHDIPEFSATGIIIVIVAVIAGALGFFVYKKRK